MAKPPAKRPYDAMRDESSRDIMSMPYTKVKPKAKAPPPKAKAAPKRDADWYMRNETSQPGKFARGGKVKKMAAGGSFSEAFRAARKGGEKTFTWNGKSYTTELASEKPAARPAAKAAPASTASKSTPAAAPQASGTSNYDKFKQMTGRGNTEAAKAESSKKWSDNTNANRARLRNIEISANRAQMRKDAAARKDRFTPASAPDSSGETPYQMAQRLKAEQRASDAASARKRASDNRAAVSGRPGQALKKGGNVKKYV